jgi:hypothetical protein
VTNTTGGTTPAGWYPVAPGSSQLRWWDGSAWTEHVHEQGPAQPPNGQVEKAPEGTNPNTVWIWILALLPFTSLASLFLVNFKAYLVDVERAGQSGNPDPTYIYRAMADSGYTWVFAISFIIYAVGIVLAFFDYRALAARGVVKPFHWALSFIPSGYGFLVYMIGRFVVVRRRTGTGLAPLWLWIASTVIVIVVALIWVFSIIGSVVGTFPTSNS